jgi:hypothetical protein
MWEMNCVGSWQFPHLVDLIFEEKRGNKGRRRRSKTHLQRGGYSLFSLVHDYKAKLLRARDLLKIHVEIDRA